jgi:hypothetical protein
MLGRRSRQVVEVNATLRLLRSPESKAAHSKHFASFDLGCSSVIDQVSGR